MIFYRNFTSRLSIIVISVLISLSAIGQTKSNLSKNKVDIKIYGGQNGYLYTDGSNLITISSNDTAAIYTVKSSQGIVRQLDKYMFFIDSLKKGKTKISVYQNKPGENVIVKQKEFVAVVPKAVSKYNSLSLSPEISLGGFTSGKVKLDTLKKITSLSINENYRILQATFYIGQSDLTILSIKSKYFDSHLKEVWKRIMPNCNITIDNIEFIDKNGNRYFHPKGFTVTAIE